MYRKIVALLIISILLISCSERDLDYVADHPVLGIWVFSEYKNDTAVFKRAGSFGESRCYHFKADGSLFERKINGWCGTPPVTYENYSGTWSDVNDTVILVNVGYWGGTTHYYLDIETVSAEWLKVRTITENQK